jgi:ABC-2 type transport system permease protein
VSATWKIFKHEIYMQISRPSFWIFVLGIPLLGIMILAGQRIGKQASPGASSSITEQVDAIQKALAPEQDTRPQGYVDPGGLIHGFPRDFDPTRLLSFPSQAAAQQALETGKIRVFYVVPSDYLQSGKLQVYMNEYKMTATQNSAELVHLINYNLLGENESLLRHISQPITHLEEVNLAPKGSDAARERNNMPAMMVVYGAMSMLFLSIFGSASLLLSSLTNEKENRVMEILMVSTSPYHLLAGKISGLGLLGLFQMTVWAGSSVASVSLSGQAIQLPEGIVLGPALVAWASLFFVLGYLASATLMAGIGALVSNLREASQLSTLVMLPIMTPMLLIPLLVDSPNGTLATILSLIPLTAPTAMILRLTLGGVPLWQLLLSIALLVGWAALLIRAVAGMFRAQTLLAGAKFNWKRFALALLGKA